MARRGGFKENDFEKKANTQKNAYMNQLRLPLLASRLNALFAVTAMVAETERLPPRKHWIYKSLGAVKIGFGTGKMSSFSE